MFKFKIEKMGNITKQYNEIRDTILKLYDTNILPPADKVFMEYKDGYIEVTF